MYCKFWKEWGEEYRDGTSFWRLSKPPTGHYKNLTAPSREAELLTRVKTFKLKFKWYLESGSDQLVIPRFIVPKLVIEDEVVDMCCVWDCKKNVHNATIWAPGFMLPNTLDAEDQVISDWMCRLRITF